ncbi:MAG: hypothetical protein C6I00_07510 [Nitratiruptor sp.]|nr:hypothetical protein [Nitratiruptor sp.]NPA82937.1 hypothetical protein [Campylobacterota bacterium]
MRLAILLVPLALLALNESNKSSYFHMLQERNDPYTFDEKARFELQKLRIEAQTQKDLAKIEYQKAVDTKRIEKEAIVEEAAKEVEKEQVAVAPQTLWAQVMERIALYGLLFGLALLILAYLLFKWYHRHKRELELRRLQAEREAHERELALRERELQAQMAGKLIDAIASGNLSQEQEEKLLALTSKGINLLESKGPKS